MGKEIKTLSRREFVNWVISVGFLLLPELPPLSKPGIVFKDLVNESNNYEPDRVYPVLSSFPFLPVEYALPVGYVEDVTEEELVRAFSKMVVLSDPYFFASKDKLQLSRYWVCHPINLDPKLYGGQLHLGFDLTTTDPHKKNTIFLNPIRGRLVGRVDIGRLSPGTPIVQVVDKENNDLRVTFGDVECGVFMLYGHLVDLKNIVNDVVEVGFPLGDITYDGKIGGSTGPHCHIEMRAIPLSKLESGKTIQRILLEDEYGETRQNVYMDTNFIWKFMPGNIHLNIGIAPEIFGITHSLEEKKKHYGE